jgi:CDP-glucose 4,6-dehydratase
MEQFWRGRRVLVTGHTGFKGGWLCLWLKALGADVTGYALAPATNPSLFEVARVGEGLRSVIADIRDLPILKKTFAAAQPEIVIHMAAQPLVRASYANPVETYATNVLGTVNVLEAARTAPSVKAIVNVTSDKCYENREWVWGYRENESMGGHDPYSSSKGCAELVTSAYRRSFGLPLASARAGNVIGGGDWSADRLVPDILKSLAADQPVEIRNPNAIRPWQHVLEPLRGYLMLAARVHGHSSEFAEGWNFGPRDEDCRPVSEIVATLVDAWGGKAAWGAQPGEHPHEAGYLKLDSSKARTRLGWSPRTSLAEGLAMTVAWHRAWLAGEDMNSLTLRQIEHHG